MMMPGTAKKQRIPALVAAGFAMLLVLGLATSTFLLFHLRKGAREDREFDLAMSRVMGPIRALEEIYGSQMIPVALLTPSRNDDLAAEQQKERSMHERAWGKIREAFRFAQGPELRKCLMDLEKQDAGVTAPIGKKVLDLAVTDQKLAKKLYMEEFLPAQAKNRELVREAWRLAMTEQSAMEAYSSAAEVRTVAKSRFDIGAFTVLGLAVAIYLTRKVAGLVREGQESLQRVKNSEERFQIISRATHDGLWDWNLETNTVWLSDTFVSLLGYEPGELNPTSEALLGGLHPAESKKILKGLESFLAGSSEVWSAEHKFRRADGTYATVLDRGYVVRNEDGKALRMVGSYMDITARKAAQLELQIAKETAESANRAKGEFLANVSHEIRTPMNGIIGMTELVLDTELRHTQRESLAMALDSANSLLRLLNDILDFSKIEAGKMELEEADFSLRKCVSDVIKPQRIAAERKGLDLRVEIPESVSYVVTGDPSRLGQVLTNLIDNAIKFTSKGSIVLGVKTATDQNNQYLEFSVADTGIGIAPDKRALIFDAFFQADGSATRNYGGTGIGLAIASQLVGQMGGRIWVESVLGEHSTFRFTMPLRVNERAKSKSGVAFTPLAIAESAAIHANAAQSKRPQPSSRRNISHDLRILIAEDNAVNRAVVVGILGQAGYVAVQAKNGTEAVTAFKREQFDVVLMDIQMPELDGSEATACIREFEEMTGRHAVIVALTAHAMAGDEEKCLMAGMDHYLSKPVQREQLLLLLEKVAAAQAQEAVAIQKNPISSAHTSFSRLPNVISNSDRRHLTLIA